ncbi:MAG: metallophosphoesterase family protein [Cyclobacteriaceae bacterium]
MRFKLPAVFLSLLFLFSCGNGQKEAKNLPSVAKVMDEVVSRLYNEYEKTSLDTLSHQFFIDYLSDTEKEALASQYWKLEVNVPVTVSLMRDQEQKVVPFWLEDSGFELTNMVVKNTHSTYEVWQKDFDAGPVNLGINGFGKHRPVYFLGIAPKNPKDSLEISPVFPEKQHFETFDVGTFTYHDWDELTLTEVPSSLKGQQLLTTIRGRAREAHLVDAFRSTPFPSSSKPDHLLLTWSADPMTTMDIQWRTDQTVPSGMVKYWKKGHPDTLETRAEKFLMEDRLLQNDRFIHRFTANLKSLEQGNTYEYMVGNQDGGWTEPQQFSTAPNSPSPFSFIWFGDVHNSEIWGELAQKSEKAHPDNDFYFIAGDLVNTGLHRDDWDQLFQYAGSTFSRKPLMAVPGNHDSQDGLGAWMYEEMLSLPKDSPSKEMEGRTYAFNYQNALFLMIDATFPLEDQTHWIEQKLSESNATWKMAVFHFPPYNAVEPYHNIQEEWVPLFDKYHVDMVLGGHFHYYMRSQPLKNGEVQPSTADGTLYLISIGTTGKNKEIEKAPYAAVQFPAEHLYQLVDIDGNTLKYSSVNFEGETVDQFEISK